MIRSADCRRSVNVDEPLLYLSFLQSPGSVYRTKEILRNCIRQVTEQKHGTIRSHCQQRHADDITQKSSGYRIVGTINARYGSPYKGSREILLRPVLPPPFRLPFAYGKRVLHSDASKGFHAARLSSLGSGIEFASPSES
ncbi:uncharacterized protein LOC114929156 isoform X2 [Nylanderia fulva]|uniref:uncharacterized protein LOC114929156 isoform X2 n=1 Tax=Nylanderia fulva TaxID=613905 RepID=UPI0010FAE1D3|nr:uncharacterized protein LOC114929156 isoform X2 [Nylanderia fulva]